MNMPSKSKMPNMMSSITRPETSKLVTHSINFTLAPDAANTLENRLEPNRIISAMMVTRPAPHMDFQSATRNSGQKARTRSILPVKSGTRNR